MIGVRGRRGISMGATLLLVLGAQAQVAQPTSRDAAGQHGATKSETGHGTADELIHGVESDLQQVDALLALVAAGKRAAAPGEQTKTAADLLEESLVAGRSVQRGIEELLRLAAEQPCSVGGT